MPRTFKPTKKQSKPPKINPVNTPSPKISHQSNGFISNILQGFSFGTGLQASKELFSSDKQVDNQVDKQNSSNTIDQCAMIKNNLEKCNQQYQYDCQYLYTLFEEKCKGDKSMIFTMNNK